MLFSLSILLVLLFSQIFLMEPFYKATLKKDIISLNRNIYDIMISDMEEDVKSSEINKVTASKNACILIYNATTTDSKSSDALGCSAQRGLPCRCHSVCLFPTPATSP